MAKKKDMGLLIETLEYYWHETYNDIISQYKAIDAKQKVKEGHIHLTPKEMKNLTAALGQLIACSHVIIDWGKELEKSDGLKWATALIASMTGFKDAKE